ncbi:MAG: hypothetical protein J3Q66DRAFT_430047 [Benniella sp.]|nr:MAG: hypothetical protein J3Q66DRAFT_430047 [Benniella sp.]
MGRVVRRNKEMLVPILVKQSAISMRLSCWFRTILNGDSNQAGGDAVQPTLTTDHEGGKIEQNPESSEGISFSKMLMILARYKLVEDESSFSIEEQLCHRQRMERLHPLVNEMVVQESSPENCSPVEVPEILSRSVDGNGSGVGGTGNSEVQAVGSTQTRHRPPVWISSDNMTLQTSSVERPLTPEEATVEIYNLRSTWKSRIVNGDLLSNDAFRI